MYCDFMFSFLYDQRIIHVVVADLSLLSKWRLHCIATHSLQIAVFVELTHFYWFCNNILDGKSLQKKEFTS